MATSGVMPQRKGCLHSLQQEGQSLFQPEWGESSQILQINSMPQQPTKAANALGLQTSTQACKVLLKYLGN